MILIIIFIACSCYPQIRTLSEAELRNELMRCLIERLGFKQQAELTDSLVSEIQKSHQREWLKDYELRICADEKFNLSQQLLNYECPKQSWIDHFEVGFLGSVLLIILTYVGIAVL